MSMNLILRPFEMESGKRTVLLCLLLAVFMVSITYLTQDRYAIRIEFGQHEKQAREGYTLASLDEEKRMLSEAIQLSMPEDPTSMKQQSQEDLTPTNNDHSDDRPIVDAEDPRCPGCCQQSDRLEHLREYCRAHPELNTISKDPRNEHTAFRFLLASHPHRMLMCVNTKAGSRLWSDTLVRSSSMLLRKTNKTLPYVSTIFNQNQLHSAGISNLRDFNSTALDHVISTYFKAIIVRHPMERIFSAYRDKFVFAPMGEGTLKGYQYVMKKYRMSTPTELSTEQSRTMAGVAKITLDEFVRLVVDPEAPFNVHWDQYALNCNPCAINYDYIIKSETNTWDAKPLIEKLSRGGINTRLLHHAVNSRDHKDVLKKMQKPILSRVIQEFASVNAQNLQSLLTHFQHDMDMFGYRFNASSLVTSCEMNSSSGKCC